MNEDSGQGSPVKAHELDGSRAVPGAALGGGATPRPGPGVPPGLEGSVDPSAYRSDWQHFVAWCDSRTVSSLPAAPETVALYLVALAEIHRPATLTRRLTSIAKVHTSSRLVSAAPVFFEMRADFSGRRSLALMCEGQDDSSLVGPCFLELARLCIEAARAHQRHWATKAF